MNKAFKHLIQSYNILTPKQRIKFFAIITANIIGTGLEVLALALFLPFMNLILDTAPKGTFFEDFLKKHFIAFNEDPILFMSILLATLYTFKGVYFFYIQWWKGRVFTQTKREIRDYIFSSILLSPYRIHLQRHSAEVQNTMVNSISRFFLFINNILLILLETSIAFGIGLFLFVKSPMTTIIALFLFSIFYLAVKFFISPAIDNLGKHYVYTSMNLIKCLQQALGDIKNIFATRTQQNFISQYQFYSRKDAHCEEKAAFLLTIPRLFIENFVFMFFFLMVGVLSINGNIQNSLPTMAVFAMGIVRIMPSATRIMLALNQNTYYGAHVENVYSFYTQLEKDYVSQYEMKIKEELRPYSTTKSIEVKNISFAFQNAPTKLFEGLSLTIPANSSVAFIGKTGAGKTTLADIILGLQEPSVGEVSVDGKNIKEHKDWWGACIGYIPQSIYLHDDTIRNNVAFATLKDDIDDAQVMHCLEMANIRQFVEDLPEGLDTVLGENGIRLSGGQRQRIGIARALYRKPSFLVMDEATSALDTETEEGIIKTIATLKGSLTILIIAHRLSTINECDFVYKIKDKQAILIKQSEL